jgi:transcriptional regulator with XRE-family HTH domain
VAAPGKVRPEDAGAYVGARRARTWFAARGAGDSDRHSAEYYLRLEQGRDKNPSPQLLDALARALHSTSKPPSIYDRDEATLGEYNFIATG